jgi:hypothetical protein
MPKYTIAAGDRILVQTPSEYLNIISVTGVLTVESPQFGLKSFSAYSGYKLRMPKITSVYFLNESNAETVVIAEDNNAEITQSGGGDVSIQNAVTVQKIIEPFPFEANVTFDNGTFGALSSQVVNANLHVSIPAGTAREIIPARAKTARKIDLQVISDAMTDLYIGTDNGINAGSGLLIRGSIDFIGSGSFETEAAIWAFNDSATAAKVAVMEQYRN